MQSKETKNVRIAALLLTMAALGVTPEGIKNNAIRNDVMDPPQSEESKQFYLKRAEEKRLRKRNKHAKSLLQS